jgi:Protein of unknown function (DUF2491)
MSWKTAVSYAKGVVGHKSDTEESRADRGLPLGARIGGVLNMQMSDFIRAITNGSMVKMPDSTMLMIQAISKVDIGLEGKLHRFYTSIEGENEAFLQVFTKPNGEVAELMYCTLLTRIIPETVEEQDAFTGEGGFGLGQSTYTFSREQIESLGYDKPTVDSIFGAYDSIAYQRDIGSADRDFYPPLKGTETRIDDAHGEHGLKQSIFFMPYVRSLGWAGEQSTNREYLVITTEVVQSQDGDASKREIHVDFMIGTSLDPSRISIQ